MRYPSKGWCWHREAKLIDPKQGIWHCPACQNKAEVVKAEQS